MRLRRSYPGDRPGSTHRSSRELLAFLALNTRRIPKSKDIAQTIAGEIVVSPRVVQACREQGLQGAEFRPVRHQGRRGSEPTEWSQLVITSKPLKLSELTVTGNHPFNLDEESRHRCPEGHVAGLNLASLSRMRRL